MWSLHFSQPSGFSENKHHWHLSQMFWDLNFQCRIPGLGNFLWGSDNLVFKRTITVVIIILFVGHWSKCMGLCPSYHFSLWFLYIFSCRNFFFPNISMFMINKCSVNTCNFHAYVDRGECKHLLSLLHKFPLRHIQKELSRELHQMQRVKWIIPGSNTDLVISVKSLIF